MEPIKEISSRTVVLPNDDIDTDQIIPARFLTTTTKQGLGKHLFNDWRYDKSGNEGQSESHARGRVQVIRRTFV